MSHPRKHPDQARHMCVTDLDLSVFWPTRRPIQYWASGSCGSTVSSNGLGGPRDPHEGRRILAYAVSFLPDQAKSTRDERRTLDIQHDKSPSAQIGSGCRRESGRIMTTALLHASNKISIVVPAPCVLGNSWTVGFSHWPSNLLRTTLCQESETQGVRTWGVGQPWPQ